MSLPPLPSTPGSYVLNKKGTDWDLQESTKPPIEVADNGLYEAPDPSGEVRIDLQHVEQPSGD